MVNHWKPGILQILSDELKFATVRYNASEISDVEYLLTVNRLSFLILNGKTAMRNHAHRPCKRRVRSITAGSPGENYG